MLSNLILPTFVANKEVTADQLNTMVLVFTEAIEALRDRVDFIRVFDNSLEEDGLITDSIGASYKILDYLRALDSRVTTLYNDTEQFKDRIDVTIGDWDNRYDTNIIDVVGAFSSLNNRISQNYSSIVSLNHILDGITVGVIEDLKNDIDDIQQNYVKKYEHLAATVNLAGAGRNQETVKGNATMIQDIMVDLTQIQATVPKKADLVGGKVPMSQLPEDVRNTNKGRFATLSALSSAYTSAELQSGDFAVVGTGKVSEFYSWDATDNRWETSGFSGTISSINGEFPDSTGDIEITPDTLDDTMTSNKFITQSEKDKVADAIVSSNNTVLDAIILTQAEYDALAVKSADTLYFIKEN